AEPAPAPMIGGLFDEPQPLQVEVQPDASRAAVSYEVITEPAQFQRWLEKLRNAPLFAFDTRIDGPDVQQAQLVGLAFSVSAGEAAYIPLGHTCMGVPAQLERDAVLTALRPL